MKTLRWLFCLGALFGANRMHAQVATPASTPVPVAAGYTEHEFLVPFAGSGFEGLDVLEVYLRAPGKHPLVLLTHGTSNTSEQNREVTTWSMFAQALWFARRGYVAIAVVRRGYGASGGKQIDSHGGCYGGNFIEEGETSAEDLRSVVDYAKSHLPEADVATILSVGVSTGGYAQVALTENPPQGLKAAIDFAGGRGGDGTGKLCDENNLTRAFQYFGKRSHTPMLWIYSENDKWFPPPTAKRFEAAFHGAGGADEFVMLPPDGEDGHHLYYHSAAWSATVEGFLREHDLLPVSPPYPGPTPPKVEPPAGLPNSGVSAFHNFLIFGPQKAFASNGHGAWGMSNGQYSQELADRHAMDECNKLRHDGPACLIVVRTASK
jgi:dienelactone hydrolase